MPISEQNRTVAVVAGVGLLGAGAAVWLSRRKKARGCSTLEPGMTEDLAFQKYYSTNYLEYVRQFYLVDLGPRGYTGQLCGESADAIYADYLRVYNILVGAYVGLSFVTAGSR